MFTSSELRSEVTTQWHPAYPASAMRQGNQAQRTFDRRQFDRLQQGIHARKVAVFLSAVVLYGVASTLNIV